MQSPPSLDVVEDTVRREYDAHTRRADAADTRAGLLLGFAGLLVSLGGDGWPPLAVAARLLAAAAGLVALTALSVAQRPDRFDGTHLLRHYLRRDPVETRLRLLTSDIWTIHLAQRRFRAKVARLRLATTLVMAAIALGVFSVTVEAITR